jgi:hypothetical protein
MLYILPPVYSCAEFDYTECCFAKCRQVCAIKTTAIVPSVLLSIVIRCLLYAACYCAVLMLDVVMLGMLYSLS